MTRERDSQRSKVYAAERAAREIPGSRGRDLPTVAELQAYVDDLVRTGYEQRRIQVDLPWRVVVTDGRGRRRGGSDADSVAMPRFARYEAYLLHEVAHVFAVRRFGWNPASHGWQWAAVYLDLVRDRLGPEAEAVLVAEFRARRVRFEKPRARRTVDPVAAARNTARLAEVNAARSEAAAARRAEIAARDSARQALVDAGAVLVEWGFGAGYIVDRPDGSGFATLCAPSPTDWAVSKSPRQAILYPSAEVVRAHWAEATEKPWPTALRTLPAKEVLDLYEEKLARRRRRAS